MDDIWFDLVKESQASAAVETRHAAPLPYSSDPRPERKTLILKNGFTREEESGFVEEEDLLETTVDDDVPSSPEGAGEQPSCDAESGSLGAHPGDHPHQGHPEGRREGHQLAVETRKSGGRYPMKTSQLAQDLLRLSSSPAVEALMQQETPMKVEDGIFGAVVNWFNCLWIDKKQLEKKQEENWEIRFEDVEELKWLGSGAHGCVFLGKYKEEQVAVKKLKELKMTLKEERLLRTLKHKNVIGFRGVCSQPPVYCVIMEYCPRSLFEVIQEHEIPPALVVHWGSQIACGMEYLHSKGVIHRDLKSPNILIASDNDTLKITDFGTSHEFKGKSTKMSFNGTVAWMAPEIIRSESCNAKVDVWSFGVVLWELLTGELPYKGVDAGAIVWGVGSNSLHLPVPSTAPDGFTLILKQCWNAEPKHRPEFRQIVLHMEILANDVNFVAKPCEEYFAIQSKWKSEIQEKFLEMKKAEGELRKLDDQLIRKREEELKHAQDIRLLYEQKLQRANEFYQELAQMERDLRARERDIEAAARKRNGKRNNGRLSDRKKRKGTNKDRSAEGKDLQLTSAHTHHRLAQQGVRSRRTPPRKVMFDLEHQADILDRREMNSRGSESEEEEEEELEEEEERQAGGDEEDGEGDFSYKRASGQHDGEAYHIGGGSGGDVFYENGSDQVSGRSRARPHARFSRNRSGEAAGKHKNSPSPSENEYSESDGEVYVADANVRLSSRSGRSSRGFGRTAVDVRVLLEEAQSHSIDSIRKTASTPLYTHS